MKTLGLILFLAVISVHGISAEVKNTLTDSSKINETYIDENKNGINEKGEKGKCYRGKRRDKFIDENNDGICDDREKGIGPKRRHKHGKNRN